MLKDESILEKFDLVEELEDKIAETINGGLNVKNDRPYRKTLFVLNPNNSTAQIYQINSGATQTILGENLFFVWDKQPGAAWDFDIRGGFLSSDQLVLRNDSGQDILDYDFGSVVTATTAAESLAGGGFSGQVQI